MRVLAADGAALVFVCQPGRRNGQRHRYGDRHGGRDHTCRLRAGLHRRRSRTARRSTSRTPSAGRVSVIDAAKRRVVRALAIGGTPVRHRCRPGRHAVRQRLEQQHGHGHRSRRPGARLREIHVGRAPAGIVASPACGARLRRQPRERLGLASSTRRRYRSSPRCPWARAPFALTVSPDATRVYVANVQSADISVISTRNAAADRDGDGRADAVRRGNEHRRRRVCSSPTRAPARSRCSTAATAACHGNAESRPVPRGHRRRAEREARPTSPTGSRATCRCSTPQSGKELKRIRTGGGSRALAVVAGDPSGASAGRAPPVRVRPASAGVTRR